MAKDYMINAVMQNMHARRHEIVTVKGFISYYALLSFKGSVEEVMSYEYSRLVSKVATLGEIASPCSMTYKFDAMLEQYELTVVAYVRPWTAANTDWINSSSGKEFINGS